MHRQDSWLQQVCPGGRKRSQAVGGPDWWVPEQAEEEMSWGETTWTWIIGKNGGRAAGFLGKCSPTFPRPLTSEILCPPTPPQKVRRCGVGPRCLVLKRFPGDLILPRIGSPFTKVPSSQSRTTPQLPMSAPRPHQHRGQGPFYRVFSVSSPALHTPPADLGRGKKEVSLSWVLGGLPVKWLEMF